MYLKQLKITNYKSFFETTEFDFEPGFNVLLGANSSGKTSVLEAMCFHDFQPIPHRSYLVAKEIDSSTKEGSSTEVGFSVTNEEVQKLIFPAASYVLGIDPSVTQLQSSDFESLKMKVRDEPLTLEVSSEVSISRVSQLVRLRFTDWPCAWRVLNQNQNVDGLQVLTVGDPNGRSTYGTNISDSVSLWQRIPPKIYKFSSERSIHSVYGHHPNSDLLPNGQNLAYCINHLQSDNPHLSQELNRLLNRVFPTIHWVGAPGNGNNQFELKIHTNPSQLKRNDLAVPISRVGTGVGNALAMLYVALTAQTERFILLEEPNSYLHPRALRELLAILAAESTSFSSPPIQAMFCGRSKHPLSRCWNTMANKRRSSRRQATNYMNYKRVCLILVLA
jgi:hypothetical protein